MNRALSALQRGAIDLSASHLQAFAARNASLLSIIEQTVSGLGSDERHLALMTGDIREMADKLAAAELKNLDPDGRVVELLRLSADAALRMYNRATVKCDAARQDGRLTAADGVVDAYEAYISTVADYHNALADLLELVENLKALAEPRSSAVYTDVGAMFKDLLA